MRFARLPEFEKELKHLQKKYRSLEEDLSMLEVFLTNYPKGFPPKVVQVSNLIFPRKSGHNEELVVV